jgi:CHASE3 domain sensor protein
VQAAQLAALPLIHPRQGCLQQACWKGGRRAKSREIRREQIRQRIDAIHARIKELQAKRQDDADLAAVRERLTSAQRQMAASRAAARTAITSSLRAFRKAAEAQERAALQHERVAAAGRGDKDQHGRQAASHRAAAAAATQRAERARSLLSDEQRTDMRGSDADQALNWPVILAARGIGDLLPPEP